MRLIYTFHDDRHAKTFSSFLTQQCIENQLEISKNTDWESSNYGDLICKIWIINEDKIEASKKHLETYLENPNADPFLYLRPQPPRIPKKASIPSTPPTPINTRTPFPIRKGKQAGTATFCLIALCTLILFVSLISRHSFEPYPSNLAPTPLFSSPLEKEFYYDYPKSYEILDKLETAYGFERLLTPAELPQEGKRLLQQFYETPYWKGFYGKIVSYLKEPAKGFAIQEPLFEKLRQGEFWRLITPCFLHGDIFHLFFNMVWLFVIGKQMEKKLGIFKYILFILVAGIFSNTAQYFMSGSSFIGFSGALCAMIVFVWMRQKATPWEGYQLLPSSMKFISLFILILVAAQTFSFFLEITGRSGLSIPIANTAHIAGAFIGYLLAKISFFKWKLEK